MSHRETQTPMIVYWAVGAVLTVFIAVGSYAVVTYGPIPVLKRIGLLIAAVLFLTLFPTALGMVVIGVFDE